MVGVPTKGQAMTDIQIFDYSVYTGVMDNGQEILVQIFTNPDSGKFLLGQIAFRSHVSSWGVPIPLEKL
jgi:hypothetical protein